MFVSFVCALISLIDWLTPGFVRWHRYRIAQQLQAHTGGIAVYNGIDMLSDGICVSAGHDAKSVLIWDVKSNKTEKIKHPDHVTAVHVPVKGGNLFFTACCDGFVRLFDRRYNPTRELFKLQMIGSPYSVTSCVVPGQQGGLFAVGCYNGTCEVYRCLSLRVRVGVYRVLKEISC